MVTPGKAVGSWDVWVGLGTSLQVISVVPVAARRSPKGPVKVSGRDTHDEWKSRRRNSYLRGNHMRWVQGRRTCVTL